MGIDFVEGIGSVAAGVAEDSPDCKKLVVVEVLDRR